jgi:hypothetical protein
MTELRFLVIAATLCGSVLWWGLTMPAGAAPEQGQQFAQAESPSSVAMTPSEAEARTKLEQAGYTNIRDVRAGAEAITATATKDGREVSLIIDSAGSIRQR